MRELRQLYTADPVGMYVQTVVPVHYILPYSEPIPTYFTNSKVIYVHYVYKIKIIKIIHR